MGIPTPMGANSENNNILNINEYEIKCHNEKWGATLEEKKSYFKSTELEIIKQIKKINTGEKTLGELLKLYVSFFSLMYDYRDKNNISSKFKDFYKMKKSEKDNIKIVKEVLEHKFPKSSTLNDENKKVLFKPLKNYQESYMFFRSYFNTNNKSNGCTLIATELKKQGNKEEMSDSFYKEAHLAFESGKNVKSLPTKVALLMDNLNNKFIESFCRLRLAGSQDEKKNAKDEYKRYLNFMEENDYNVNTFCSVLEDLGELMNNQNLKGLFEEVDKKVP